MWHLLVKRLASWVPWTSFYYLLALALLSGFLSADGSLSSVEDPHDVCFVDSSSWSSLLSFEALHSRAQSADLNFFVSKPAPSQVVYQRTQMKSFKPAGKGSSEIACVVDALMPANRRYWYGQIIIGK